MDLSSITQSIDCRRAGTLFWTTDMNGNIWVLLARRRVNAILGRAYTFTIPTVSLNEDEREEDGAARAGHLRRLAAGGRDGGDRGAGRLQPHPGRRGPVDLRPARL